MSSYFPKYQSANLSNNEIIDNFVVRTKEFEKVMKDIRTTEAGTSFQHYIFVGRRGAGKSTLLRRIQAEVCTKPDLTERFIVTNLSEEQTGIYQLYDLWDYVIRDLQAKSFSVPTLDWQDYQDDLTEYTKQLYFEIHDCLQREGKQLILLIDNIDRLFRNIGKDANLLREQLMNFNDVRIIGGSTVMSEQFWKYSMPFYQFFSLRRLEPLTVEEVKQLLTHWADVKGLPEIKDFSRFHAGKLQAIRLLTDGTPRTMQLFVDMLLDRPLQKGFDFLKNILDQATPVYQERLANLTPQQQKIVTELSFFWEATTVEKLVPVCKMEGKTISAQLGKLAKEGVVEKIKGEKRQLLYRLEERFFNLWLLMTQGGPQQRQEVKYLTVFLESWYDADELKGVFHEFMKQLETGELNPDYIASMAKAFAHSKILTIEERDDVLYKVEGLPEMKKEWLEQLPETALAIYDRVAQLTSAKQFDQATKEVEKIEQDAPRTNFLLGILYILSGKIDKGRDYLQKTKEMATHVPSLQGEILYTTGNYEQAEKHLLAALQYGKKLPPGEWANCYYALARNYYRWGKKPKEAAQFSNKYIELGGSELVKIGQAAILNLWAGEISVFQEMHEASFRSLLTKSNFFLRNYLLELLIHKQYQLVFKVFIDHNLKKQFVPLYYATLHLIDSDHPELLKTPPELSENISDILKEIKEKQSFYYPSS